MNPVVLISSCARDRKNGAQEIQRQSCFACDLPCRFLLGRGNTNAQRDEVILDIPDDYDNLPLKTREGHRWALDQCYDLFFQCFTDTYFIPSRLLAAARSLPAGYVGNFGCPNPISRIPDHKGRFAYASGGAGYWLDRPAAEVLVEAQPDHWAEDLWVGNVMGRAGIVGYHDPRYHRRKIGFDREAIAIHLSLDTGIYNPQWMRALHEQYRKAS